MRDEGDGALPDRGCAPPHQSADAIVVPGAAYPGRVVIGHLYRLDPRWMALRTAVEDGRLGRIGHISTHGYTPDYEGRALADHMSLANENSDGQRWPVTAAEARSALRVALAVDRSLALERPVAVAEMG